MQPPETCFARIGGDRVAYQIAGEGRIDLVYCPGAWSHVDLCREHPRLSTVIRRLTAFSRVIRFDRRGSGASDPLALDERAPLERGADDVASAARRLMAQWGGEDFVRAVSPGIAADDDFRRWYAKYLRACASPREATTYFEHLLHADVRSLLNAVTCPTLVMHYDHALVPVAQGRFLAGNVAAARFELLPGDQSEYFTERRDRVLAMIEEFLTGVAPTADHERVLATVLFTDIVGSTQRAAALGDQRWQELLDRHDVLVRRHVARAGGRLVRGTGDGVLATFDGAARAIHCALALVADLRDAGIDIRAALHTGEVEIHDGDVGGIAVHLAARVLTKCRPGEILITRTVRDLVLGSAIHVEERGAHVLKGVPGPWQLFAVAET